MHITDAPPHGTRYNGGCLDDHPVGDYDIPASLRRGLAGDLLHLPRALALMLRALATSRGANRRFLHTPHVAAHVTAQS